MRGIEQQAPEVLSAVEPYVRLMEGFTSGSMPVEAFERAYLDTFTDDPTPWPEELYQILNEVFLDVDAYFPDPSFWDDMTFGEEELRQRVEHALGALCSLRLAVT